MLQIFLVVGERKLRDLQFVRVILVRSFFPSVNGVIFFIFKQQDSPKWDADKRIQMLINSRLVNFVLTGLMELKAKIGYLFCFSPFFCGSSFLLQEYFIIKHWIKLITMKRDLWKILAKFHLSKRVLTDDKPKFGCSSTMKVWRIPKRIKIKSIKLILIRERQWLYECKCSSESR